MNASTPLKFLQVHTFYPSYLEKFYGERPGLDQKPYQEQFSELMSDGFSGSHLFGVHMQEAGYDARLVIANNPFLQSQWCRENRVTPQFPEHWVREVVMRQIEAFQPDILYLSDPINFDSQFTRLLSWKPRLIVGWRAAMIPEKIDWGSFDLMLSHLSVCREKAMAMGARSAAHFFPGIPDFIMDAIRNEPKRHDLVFTGQWTHQHARRNVFLNRAIEKVSMRKEGNQVGLFVATPHPHELSDLIKKHNQGERWGLAMHRVLASGRIVLNAEIDLARGEAGNMRLFEATSSGAFLLTEHHENLNRYFEPGVEVETYRDEKELCEKIDHYLDHPEEREAIARRGQERCLRDYNMHRRVRELDRILGKFLNLKNREEPKHACGI